MAFTTDDQLLLGALEASDSDCLAVETMDDLRCLSADVLGRREQPVVGLTLDANEDAPVLACGDVRAVVGPGVRIYLIFSDDLLFGLRQMLGGRLAIDRGMARIWWPGAGARCDATDHPAVLALEDEPYQLTLGEFALRFDLTRPRVRGQIRLIEDARAFLEHELGRAREQNRRVHERLRDAQIECHAQRTRAEAAEASLAAAQRPPDLGRR
jgi:hypothetical protein